MTEWEKSQSGKPHVYNDEMGKMHKEAKKLYQEYNKTTDEDEVQITIRKAIENHVTVVSMHTNMDSAQGGVNHKIAENQFSDFDEFLKNLDMVVVMVKHDHIKQNWDKLKGKVVLDCFNICPLEGVYHI